MAAAKTKAVVALGLLDIARQVAHAWSAKREAERERLGFGAGVRADARQLARDARDRLPDRLEWGMPPWRREPTFGERVREWAPLAVVMALSTAAVILAARTIARTQPDGGPDAMATDSRMVGAVRAGSKAIDAGVGKVVEGSATAAVGTASAVAAGSAAIKQAAVKRAKDEVDERIVQPAKAKGIRYGSVALLGLTAYVVVVAALVQLGIDAVT